MSLREDKISQEETYFQNWKLSSLDRASLMALYGLSQSQVDDLYGMYLSYLNGGQGSFAGFSDFVAKKQLQNTSNGSNTATNNGATTGASAVDTINQIGKEVAKGLKGRKEAFW